MGAVARIEIPPKLLPVFSPRRGEVRYRAAYGGRGSGKSRSFALMAAVFGYAEPLRILCTRELQVSIKESMHAELRQAIEAEPWLRQHYEIGESYIRGANGTEFLFRGLRYNMSAIKSMAGIDLCIIEEAEDVPEASWLDLEPTIRAPKSELWVIWNPRRDGSPVDKRFRKSTPPRAVVAEVHADDNPWLPDELIEQREHNRVTMDPQTFAHVWEGAYLENSDAQVLAGKWRVEDFHDPLSTDDGPYYGADWGFAQDPTTLVACFMRGRTLYVWHETGAVGCEIDETAALFDKVPGSRTHTIRADSARPETISYMRRQGFRIEGVEKWPKSVEDGITWLRSLDEIVIHPRCKRTIEEARMYSYKVDRLSGDVMPVIVDAHNHYIDAIRYACAPMIRQRGAPRVRRL